MTSEKAPQIHVEGARTPHPVRVWYVVLMGFVAIVGGFVLTLWFIGYQGQKTRADVCDVVRSQLAVYNENPPSTPTGMKARDSWSRLNIRLECNRVTAR